MAKNSLSRNSRYKTGHGTQGSGHSSISLKLHLSPAPEKCHHSQCFGPAVILSTLGFFSSSMENIGKASLPKTLIQAHLYTTFVILNILLTRAPNTAGRLRRALFRRRVNQNIIELVALRCWQKSIACYGRDGTRALSCCPSHQMQLKRDTQ